MEDPRMVPIPSPMAEASLLKDHLLGGIINGEDRPTGKHTSTLHLFSHVVNCYTGFLGTQSAVHYTEHSNISSALHIKP